MLLIPAMRGPALGAAEGPTEGLPLLGPALAGAGAAGAGAAGAGAAGAGAAGAAGAAGGVSLDLGADESLGPPWTVLLLSPPVGVLVGEVGCDGGGGG
ncbi:MAG: hypothetical protein ACTHN5_05425, partial [Phycisphaerae bacterium]